MLTDIADHTFTAEVLESDRPVLVDFWAPWCPPCRAMHPILQELAAERDDLRVVRLDTDANPETMARHGVLSIPTLMLFKDGQPVLRLTGSRPKRRLVRELSEALEQVRA